MTTLLLLITNSLVITQIVAKYELSYMYHDNDRIIPDYEKMINPTDNVKRRTITYEHGSKRYNIRPRTGLAYSQGRLLKVHGELLISYKAEFLMGKNVHFTIGRGTSLTLEDRAQMMVGDRSKVFIESNFVISYDAKVKLSELAILSIGFNLSTRVNIGMKTILIIKKAAVLEVHGQFAGWFEAKIVLEPHAKLKIEANSFFFLQQGAEVIIGQHARLLIKGRCYLLGELVVPAGTELTLTTSKCEEMIKKFWRDCC